MEIDTVLFNDILEHCFHEAVEATRHEVRKWWNWLRASEGYYSEPRNWGLTIVNICWCNVLRWYADPGGSHFPGEEVEKDCQELSNCRLVSVSRIFLPDLIIGDRMVIESAMIPYRFPADKAPEELLELLMLFNGAAADLLRRADDEIGRIWPVMMNLHARYNIIRTSLESFAQERRAKLTLLFYAPAEMFDISFQPVGRKKDIHFNNVPMDNIGHFLEWLPAIYDANLNHREYWPLPNR